MNVAPDGRNVFQVIVSDDDQPESALRNTTKQNRASLRSLYADFAYHLLDGDAMRAIIGAHFSREVLDAFDTLTPYSFKVDLAKYCLMLQYGGVYSDISMYSLKRLSLEHGRSIACFRDAFGLGMSPWALSAGLMMAKPGQVEFRCAIDLVVENCRKRHYGAHCLDPTGPGLMGRAFAQIDRARNLCIGDFRCLTGLGYPEAFAYIDHHGAIIALRMKSIGADLDHVGVTGTNNYNDLYNSQVVYGEDVTRNAGDERLSTIHGGVSAKGVPVESWMEGHLVCGPYVALPSGDYEVKYRFAEDFTFDTITIDLVCDQQLVSEQIFTQLDETAAAIMSFRLQRFAATIETRLHSSGGAQGHCLGYTIRRLAGTPWSSRTRKPFA